MSIEPNYVRLEPNVRSCCFHFEDERVISEKANRNTGNVKGNVIYRTADGGVKTFGFYAIKQDGSLRCIQIFLLSSLFIPIVRVPARIISLFSGDFYRAGRKFARQQFLLEKSQNPDLGRCRYSVIIAKHTAWQLVKNIAQIVTYPLASLAMFFVALYGASTNKVHDARLLYATIENAWSPSVIESVGKVETRFHLHRITHYLGGCQLPKEVWDEKNLYRAGAFLYHPEAIRSLLRDIIWQLKENRQFFLNKGVPVELLEKELETYQKNNKKINREIVTHTEEYLPTEEQRDISNCLKDIKNYLNKFESDTLGALEDRPVLMEGYTPVDRALHEKEVKAREPLSELDSKRLKLMTSWLIGMRALQASYHLPKAPSLKDLDEAIAKDHTISSKDRMKEYISRIDRTLRDCVNEYFISITLDPKEGIKGVKINQSLEGKITSLRSDYENIAWKIRERFRYPDSNLTSANDENQKWLYSLDAIDRQLQGFVYRDFVRRPRSTDSIDIIARELLGLS